MQGIQQTTVLAVLVALAAACAPATPSAPGATGASPGGGAASAGAARTPKSLTVVMVGEPRGLSMWKENTTTAPVHLLEMLTNALIGQNANSEPIPRLSANVPSVEQGTWKVFADGTMETTYRLQPNAFWHDGTPFTARDVVFSWRVQLDPQIEALVRGLKDGGVTRVEAPDDKTVVMHWSKPYGFADSLDFWYFTPLPAHLLEAVYDRDPNELNNHVYFAEPSAFVGTGPFRLVRWEKGAQLELQAFDRYYLGRPKIDRVIVDVAGDENIAVSRVLAGGVDMAWRGTWSKDNMELVRNRGLGDFVLSLETANHFAFQYKDVLQTPAIARDVRLRRAFAHLTDRAAINEASADGMGFVMESWIPPNDPRLAAAEPFIQRYPLDPARGQQLFAEAGWTRGGDGLLRNVQGQALQCEINSGATDMPAALVLANSWKQVGVDVAVEERPTALARDPAYRANFKCVEMSARNLGRSLFTHLHTSNAMLPPRYAGNNRGAYQNPELDRLLDAWFAASTIPERLSHEREAIRLITTELPIVQTIADPAKYFQGKGVSGIVPKGGLDIRVSASWNSHEWDKSY